MGSPMGVFLSSWGFGLCFDERNHDWILQDFSMEESFNMISLYFWDKLLQKIINTFRQNMRLLLFLIVFFYQVFTALYVFELFHTFFKYFLCLLQFQVFVNNWLFKINDFAEFWFFIFNILFNLSIFFPIL